MGNDLKCHMGESEEEIVEKILTEIPFKEINVSESYENLSKCLIDKEIKTTDSISSINSIKNVDCFNFSSYINSVVNKENSKCKLIHLEYFDNLRRLDDNIPILFTIIIYLSKGSKNEKITLLLEIYKKYYGTINREILIMYVKEIINANTTVCIDSFHTTFGLESSCKLKEIYNEAAKKKLLENIIINYTSVFDKYIGQGKTPSFEMEKFDFNNNEKMMNEFFELVFPMLNGEYIRNWLNEEYDKERPKMNGPCCL